MQFVDQHSTTQDTSRLREVLWLSLIVVLGLCLRLDEAHFHHTALSLMGMVPEDDSFMYQPLYPMFLAGVYSVFGVHMDLVRHLQLFIGLGTILVFYGLGRELGGRTVGRLSALGAAAYGPLIFFEGQLLAPGLVVPLVTAAIWAFLRAERRKRMWPLLLAGVLIGLALMGRPNLLFLLPAAGLWWLFKTTGWRLRFLGMVLALAGLTLGLLPSWIHNAVRGQAFTPISTSGGHSFFLGNNPKATGRFHVPSGQRINDGSHSAYWQSLRALAEEASGRSLDAAEVSNYWYGRGLDFWHQHPGQAISLLGKKFLLGVNSEEMPIHNPYFVVERIVPVLSWLFRFSLIFSFALVGGILGWRTSRGAGLLVLCAGVYLAGLMVFYVADRYRLQLLPMLLPLAALGVVALREKFREKSIREVGPWLLVLAMAFALTQVPTISLEAKQRGLVSSYNRMGKAEGDKGHLHRAAHWFRQALAIAGPGQASRVKGNLGLVAEKQGQLENAEDWYRQAAKADEENRFVRYKLARFSEKRGAWQDALGWLRQVERLEADPSRVRRAIEIIEKRLSSQESQ